jgi:aldose 1-epimerase
MSVKKALFGVTERGEKVYIVTLANQGMSVSIAEWGATVVSVVLPSRHFADSDVVLGFSTLSGYGAAHPYFGATVGRYANRIAKAAFTLDGVKYDLEKNDGLNTLHGGAKSWAHRVWKSSLGLDGKSVTFYLESPDGDAGFPGMVKAWVTYSLTKDNELEMTYKATTTKATPINLTNHSYFNLAGEGKGDILSHDLTLYCSNYLPIDSTTIPTGDIKAVKRTPFDFLTPKAIGKDIKKVGSGYDHCFVVDKKGPDTLDKIATVSEPVTGRKLELFGTQVGVQLYTSNYIESIVGKRGSLYGKHAALCLETQSFPDSPNKPKFPSSILKPGERYEEKVVYAFSW